MLDFVVLVVCVCTALGILAWSTVAGASLVRNVVAIAALAWEAVTAIPAVIRHARRRFIGGGRL